MADDTTTETETEDGDAPRRNLKVTDETYQKHKARKDEQGLTWDEYLDAQRSDVYDSMETVIRDVVREETANAGGGSASDGDREDVLNENALREIVREEATKAIRDNLQTR